MNPMKAMDNKAAPRSVRHDGCRLGEGPAMLLSFIEARRELLISGIMKNIKAHELLVLPPRKKYEPDPR